MINAQNHHHTWRLFWALPLPTHLQEEIAAIQEELARKIPPNTVRWTPPHHIHLTLVFLGNWKRSQVPHLKQGVEEALLGIPPFTLEVEAAGVFPNWRRPRVIWLGVGGEIDVLRRLQAAVARAMVQAGWEPEKRPYSPHLTIGRVRKGLDDNTLARIGDVVRRLKVDPFGRHRVHQVILFRSDLRPSGAVYTPVAEVKLKEE